MTNPEQTQVHRFRDHVAISFFGVKGETVYLSAKEAQRIAAALSSAARDIEDFSFANSNFQTETIARETV